MNAVHVGAGKGKNSNGFEAKPGGNQRQFNIDRADWEKPKNSARKVKFPPAGGYAVNSSCGKNFAGEGRRHWGGGGGVLKKSAWLYTETGIGQEPKGPKEVEKVEVKGIRQEKKTWTRTFL